VPSLNEIFNDGLVAKLSRCVAYLNTCDVGLPLETIRIFSVSAVPVCIAKSRSVTGSGAIQWSGDVVPAPAPPSNVTYALLTSDTYASMLYVLPDLSP